MQPKARREERSATPKNKLNNSNNIKFEIMSRNLILGIVTGVAAVVVIGIVVKKTGLLNGLVSKLGDLADDVEDRFADLNLEKFGMHDVIPKGEDKNVSKAISNSVHN